MFVCLCVKSFDLCSLLLTNMAAHVTLNLQWGMMRPTAHLTLNFDHELAAESDETGSTFDLELAVEGTDPPLKGQWAFSHRRGAATPSTPWLPLLWPHTAKAYGPYTQTLALRTHTLVRGTLVHWEMQKGPACPILGGWPVPGGGGGAPGDSSKEPFFHSK